MSEKPFDAWNTQKKTINSGKQLFTDTSRLINKIGVVEEKMFETIRKAVRDML